MVEADRLYALASSARVNAYAPYSKFAVGAALLAADGRIFTGVNVENASYGLAICAERNALFAAVALGVRTFAALAVAGPPDVTTLPCGACRQVLAEFNPDLLVIFSDSAAVVSVLLSELFPRPFSIAGASTPP